MKSAGEALLITRKNGSERFHDGGRALEADLLGFWQWSCSNLVSNTMRGVLAEYIVALAVGSADGMRREWEAYDLVTPEGVKVEVKSAAFIQSWRQERRSRVQFGVAMRRAWNAISNRMSDVPGRHADVYVFAHLKHEDRGTIDPLDLEQWAFYVLPTSVLDARQRSQHSISLASLIALTEPVSFTGLRTAIWDAAQAATTSAATTAEAGQGP